MEGKRYEINLMDDRTDVTRLLHAAGSGDTQARAELLSVVYQELHALARRQLLGGRDNRRTLCTTALVHEAFLRLAAQQNVGFEDRAHFLGYCAQVMRSIVVDQARRQQAEKRGGNLTRVQFGDEYRNSGAGPEQVMALEQALDQLEDVDPRLARVTELRVFGGLNFDECAVALDVSRRTAQRDWRRARAMLGAVLAREHEA